MKCEWYHVWNTMPNKWVTREEIIRRVSARYTKLIHVEECVDNMIDGGRTIKTKNIRGITKHHWRLY